MCFGCFAFGRPRSCVPAFGLRPSFVLTILKLPPVPPQIQRKLVISRSCCYGWYCTSTSTTSFSWFSFTADRSGEIRGWCIGGRPDQSVPRSSFCRTHFWALNRGELFRRWPPWLQGQFRGRRYPSKLSIASCRRSCFSVAQAVTSTEVCHAGVGRHETTSDCETTAVDECCCDSIVKYRGGDIWPRSATQE